jgi:peptidoglycan/LPS O-acetylase OafA/YrhL
MYLMAIIISYSIDYFIGHKSIDSWQIILGNIFFLQNLTVPVTSSNGALWSLNYEVVYYLIFLLIWKFRPKLLSMSIGIATIIILIWIFNPLPNILSGYLAGWIFWLIGLFLAWRVPSRVQNIKVPLISIFLLFYANKELRLGANILDVLHFNNPGETVTFGDLTIIPISILLIAIIADRIIPSKVSKIYRNLYIVSLLMPLTLILYSFLKKGSLGSENYAIAAIEIFLAVAFYWIKLSPSILKHLAFVGSISYGIYIFHGPTIGIVGNYFPFSGNVWSYLLRLIVWIVLTFALSYLMDIKVQPKIRNWVRSNIPI